MFITLSASAVWELFGEIEGAQKKVNWRSFTTMAQYNAN